jgi:adenylate cyclase class 2
MSCIVAAGATYTDAMQAAEIELKFCVEDIDAFRSAIKELGFRLVTERTFESNVLFDTSERRLRAQKQILRLRKYGARNILTHKRQSDQAIASSHFKTRIETESEIEDYDALAEVFSQLGYLPVFRYEKFRTEWEMGGGHLVLDETPIGVWAELEGRPDWIDAMLEKFGIAPELQSTDSYGTLFLKWKTARGREAENLTFEEIPDGLN